MSSGMYAFAAFISVFLAAIAFEFFKMAFAQWKATKEIPIVLAAAGIFMILLIILVFYSASLMK